MLSRNNKILVGCLALLLVMSVGYALFSDTITINGSATAKGEFEITTEAIDLSQDIYSNFVPDGNVSSGIVENPTISVSNNQVTSSVTLGAPGSYQYFGIKITNTGSIPAKLSSIIDKTNNYTIIDKNLDGDSVSAAYSPDGSKQLNAWLYADDGWMADYDIDYPITDRVPSIEIDKQMLDTVLDPGEETSFLIQYFWNIKSTEQENIEELNWQLEINFEQITE